MKVKPDGNVILDTIEVDEQFYIAFDDVRTFLEMLRIKGKSLDDVIAQFDNVSFTEKPRRRWGFR
jgi:hypothetical protein